MKRGEQEQMWRLLREVDPPPGARERALARLEPKLARGSRESRWLVGAVAAAAAAAALLLAWARSSAVDDTPAVESIAAESSTGGEVRPPSADESVAPGSDTDAAPPAPSVPNPGVRVPALAEKRLSLPAADVRVHGPAAATVDSEFLDIYAGTAQVDGELLVRAPHCSVKVRGRAQVSVVDLQTQVTLFAGSTEVVGAKTSCHVIDLRPSLEDAGELPGEGGREPEAAPADAASRLRQEVESFRRAQALRGVDDEKALRRWRAIKRRWPDGALRMEVDFEIVGALRAVGRHDEAEAAAQAFLRSYPDSAQAKSLRAREGGLR